MRKIICKIFSMSGLFEVVLAADPYEARRLIKSYKPHVITLDIEMPKMDGITFLINLMRLNPLPVVMLSTLTEKGMEPTLVAMEQGAIDFIAKPAANSSDDGLQVFAAALIEKAKIAAQSYHIVKNSRSQKNVAVRRAEGQICKQNIIGKIIAIGSSTGGVEAINILLKNISRQLPPIIITQHLPASFSKKFAHRLNNNVDIEVRVAEQGCILMPGIVYIAGGAKHLKVVNRQGVFSCELEAGPRVNLHRPSVSVMFDSLAQIPASDVLLVLLTGMGKDGSNAMKRRFDQGATCIVQDEETSVVWGMAGSAVELEGVDKVLPITEIAASIEGHYQ